MKILIFMVLAFALPALGQEGVFEDLGKEELVSRLRQTTKHNNMLFAALKDRDRLIQNMGMGEDAKNARIAELAEISEIAVTQMQRDADKLNEVHMARINLYQELRRAHWYIRYLIGAYNIDVDLEVYKDFMPSGQFSDELKEKLVEAVRKRIARGEEGAQLRPPLKPKPGFIRKRGTPKAKPADPS